MFKTTGLKRRNQMPVYYNQRDEIADTLMQQKGASTFDYGLAGLGSAAPAVRP